MLEGEAEQNHDYWQHMANEYIVVAKSWSISNGANATAISIRDLIISQMSVLPKLYKFLISK